jgi:glutamate N-acetyltransferase / amino-acid N-acetyltransferase
VSVTFANGFRAAGVACGLKASGNRDIALVQNLGPEKSVAAVFTTNRCKANPILWSEQVVKDGVAEAVLINSGGANCYTGAQGFQTTHASAELVAELLDVASGDVVVCSTGLIGEQLNTEKLFSGVRSAHAELSETGGEDAALAIMTTDTVPKLAERESSAGYRIGGMAKGAGMLAPGLATMLVVITTDAVLPAESLDAALRQATRVSFDRLDSDGCMSTNDQVTLMASGASAVAPELTEFTSLLTSLCEELALKLLDDAEGASHSIHITTSGAETEEDAVEVSRSVARNNLFKAAIYGNDPNWGRILAAVGVTKASFDPYNIDVSMNGVLISSKGEPANDRSLVDLSPKKVDVLINLNAGVHSATVVTNDLTHEYVTENSAYSS